MPIVPRYAVGEWSRPDDPPGSMFDRAIVILTQINTAVSALQALADELSTRMDAVEAKLAGKIDLSDLATFKNQIAEISEGVKRLIRDDQ
jgi:hypothetical protein